MLLALGACPARNNAERNIEAAIAKMGEYARRVCACVDKACADKVQEDLTAWSVEMVKSSSIKDAKPTEDQMKRMADVGTTYGECMAKLLEVPTKGPALALSPPSKVPPRTAQTDADSLFRGLREWARVARPQHQLVELSIWYVDAKGELDPTHGKLFARFGRATPIADDPKRRTGTPVTQTTTPSDCFGISWDHAHGWTNEPIPCAPAFEVSVACSVREIWKRAIADGAPADAVATVTVKTSTKVPSWGFWITDEARDVNIAQELKDDCPLVVEQ